MSDYFSIPLPKWTRLVVIGNNITKDQAKEILIRTDNLSFSTNDVDFAYDCCTYLFPEVATSFGSDDYISFFDLFKDTKSYIKAKNSLRKELGLLDLEYLANHRIVSCYIGGPHGWCDWQGKIGCNNYNIGKWPSVEQVFNEWQLIAKTFPFLDLKAQLLSEEDENVYSEVLVEFHIKDGIVLMVEGKELLDNPIEELSAEDTLKLICSPPSVRERGCTLEQFKEAVDYVRKKLDFKE